MDVNVTYATTNQAARKDYSRNFIVSCNTGFQHKPEIKPGRAAKTESAKHQFTNDKWMNQDFPGIKISLEAGIALAQMAYPYRCIGENH